MSFLSKLKFWKNNNSLVGNSSTDLVVGERIALNPLELMFVENFHNDLGLASGVTSVTPEQYASLKTLFSTDESWGSYGSKNADAKVTAYQVAAALGTLYTKGTETRKELIKEVDQIANFYLVDVVVSQICEDALNPDITTDQIFKIEYEDEEIQKELKHLEEKFKLDQLIKEITPDIIRYGEYTLSTVIKTEDNENSANFLEALTEEQKHDFDKSSTGLVQLNDGVDQTEVIAICKNNQVDYYLSMAQRNNSISLERKHKSSYVQFKLDSERVRVDLQKEFNNLTSRQKDEISKIPRFVRVGKSLIHSMLPKFRELELLEKLAPATKLSELSAGTLIGVQVPPGYDVKKGMEAAKVMEGIINRKLAVAEDTGRISVESLLTSVGRTKVIPLFGDKGNTTVMQTRSSAPDSLTSDITTLRKVILDGIGVPYELVFSGDSTNKVDLLKRYSRYLRKLKSVQRAIKEGLVQLVSIHLAAKGIPFKSSKIKINFFNKLIELDNLDKLEFIDGSISLINNAKSFVEDLIGSENFKDHVEKDVFIKFIKEQLRLLGMEDLVTLEPKPSEDPNGNNGENPLKGDSNPLDGENPENPDSNPLDGDGASQDANPLDAPDSDQTPSPDQEDIQKTSLNGSQIKSLLDIMQQVATKQIPRDTGVQLVKMAFALEDDEADALIGEIGKSFFKSEPDQKDQSNKE